MNRPGRRRVLMAGLARLAGLLGAASGFTGPARAQSYPAKPIRILVGIGAGGTADVVARLYGEKLSQVLGTPVIVDNKPGGFQLPAIRALLMAAPDGYTLYMANASALSLTPGIRTDLPYDPLKDFSFIGQVGKSSAVIFIHPDLPVRSLRDLVAYSVANPRAINYGSAGVGTADHVKIEYLKTLTGLQATHVPYKSGADVVREVIAGNVHMGMTTIQSPLPFIQAGKLRALNVTAAHALRVLPGVPGTAEVGIKALEAIEPYTYYGLVGPRGLPGSIVSRLNEAINKISRMEDVEARLRDTLFIEPTSGTPESLRDLAKRELARAADIGKQVSIPTH
jgi:tripartite-type tricarboxylate transporter receptor subunit TctC